MTFARILRPCVDCKLASSDDATVVYVDIVGRIIASSDRSRMKKVGWHIQFIFLVLIKEVCRGVKPKLMMGFVALVASVSNTANKMKKMLK